MVTRQQNEQKAHQAGMDWAESGHLDDREPGPETLRVRSTLTGLSDPLTLSDTQLEILEMLEERPMSVLRKRAAAQTAKGRGFGVDVAFAALGSLSIVTGIVLLFFFAALGSVLLVVGALLCAVAFEHVALADLAADELDASANAAAAIAKGKPIL